MSIFAFTSLVILFLLLETSLPFVFPGRLSSEEATELSRTCGRKPSTIELAVPHKKSAYSQLTNRTVAPWAVEVYCSEVLISKRHILTAAHCINGHTFMAEHDHSPAKFPMTCTGGASCQENQKEMLKIKIGDISYNKDVYFKGHVDGDIAVLTLKEDVTFSCSIYPACIAGTSTVYIVTLDLLRLCCRKRRYLRTVWIWSGGSNWNNYNTRVSAHLFWINEITGINVKDEDHQFVGYFYPLLYKDNRKEETVLAGAAHPTKIASYI